MQRTVPKTHLLSARQRRRPRGRHYLAFPLITGHLECGDLLSPLFFASPRRGIIDKSMMGKSGDKSHTHQVKTEFHQRRVRAEAQRSQRGRFSFSVKKIFFTTEVTENTELRLIFSQRRKDQDVNFFRLSEKNSLRSLRLCSFSALMEFILCLFESEEF
jgi:hypothetical protein